MTFDEVLDQVRELLQQRGRVTYRALKLRYQLDDEMLAGVTDELIEAERVAHDEDGKVLVWAGKGRNGETRKGEKGEGSPGSRAESQNKSKVQSLESKKLKSVFSKPSTSPVSSKRNRSNFALQRASRVCGSNKASVMKHTLC